MKKYKNQNNEEDKFEKIIKEFTDDYAEDKPKSLKIINNHFENDWHILIYYNIIYNTLYIFYYFII